MELDNNDGKRPCINRKRKNTEIYSHEDQVDSRHFGASSQEASGIDQENGQQDMLACSSIIQHTDTVDAMGNMGAPVPMGIGMDSSKVDRLYNFFAQESTRPITSDMFMGYYENSQTQKRLKNTAQARGEKCHVQISDAEAQGLVMGLLGILERCNEESIGRWDRSLLESDELRERVGTLGIGEFDSLVTMVADILTLAHQDQEDWARKLKNLIQNDFFESRIFASAGRLVEARDFYSQQQQQATIDTWCAPYKGSIHLALWEHIKGHHEMPDGYANTCAIIQSLGSGKSRTVDRLSMDHILIPICLRDPHASGFPPPDLLVRDYFLESMRFRKLEGDEMSGDVDTVYAQQRLDAFFMALFEETLKRLEIFSIPGNASRYKSLAGAFRDAMTEGQTFSSTNQYRSDFFNNIVESAMTLVDSATDENQDFIEKSRLAFNKLAAYVNASQESQIDRPLIIVAFDESSVLTEFPRPYDKRLPPVPANLRNRLSLLKELSLFTLFLSTTGQITAVLSPQGLPCNSLRIIGRDAKLFPAFTGCAFDAFALDPPNDLVTAATEWYMMHLGRPLWATRLQVGTHERSQTSQPQPSSSSESTSLGSDTSSYIKNSKQTTALRKFAIHFAVGKLLNLSGKDLELQELSHAHGLACLAQRLPIEFLSTSYVSQKALVEDHMRICLRVDPEEETMITSSVSEPILAEAAFVVMQNERLDVLSSLEEALRGFSVHKGDRGELVGHLLLLLARDDAVAEQNDPRMWKSKSLCTHMDAKGDEQLDEWSRVIKVPDFIRSLFVKEHIPVEVLKALDNHFETTFIHLNHFIKAHEADVALPNFLVGLLARGAGLFCANNQEAMDDVIPCVKDGVLRKESLRQILISIKNRKTERKSADRTGLRVMDPVRLGYATGHNAPIIRIFFELGSSSPQLSCNVTQERATTGKAYTAIDFYCAGVSSDYLKPIAVRKKKDAWAEEKWKGLLDTTRDWKDNYKPPITSSSPELDGYLKKMTPGVATEKGFWGFFPGRMN